MSKNTPSHCLSMQLFVGVMVAILLDSLWIGFVAKHLYLQAFSSFMLSPEMMRPAQWIAAIGVWFIMVVGIVHFVLPKTFNASLRDAAIEGGLYGLVVYGSYGLTNYAVFKNWPSHIVFTELLWGTAFCAVITIVLTLFSRTK